MKADKFAKEIGEKIERFNVRNGKMRVIDRDDNNNEKQHDDEYYLDIGKQPPRFAYYRHVRWEKLDEERKEKIGHGYAIDSTITQEELDYGLKMVLKHTTPEQRYQYKKQDIIFHELYYIEQKLDDKGIFRNVIKEYGCGYSNGSFTGCVPECRYYHEYGRIEDDEYIEEHNKLFESFRIVEPPDMNTKEAYEFFEQNPFLLR